MAYLDKTGLEYYHSKIKDNLKSYYGTCTTSASTQAKVVTCSGFKLETGAKISVKFTNAQTYNGTATLNVNSTGAKNITRVGTTTTTRYYWSAGEVIDFVYDGTNYIMEGKGTATTTYYGVTKLATSAVSTSTSTALTPASLNNAMQHIVTGYAPYSSSSTYAVGDRVRYSNYIYECITAITTAEAWTSEHWKQVDNLQTQINNKQDALVSGNNIKTINGLSLLGSGNIDGNTLVTKTTSISSSSTNEQIPSAKSVYDLFNSIVNGDEVNY